MSELREESLWIPLGTAEGDELHVRYFKPDESRTASSDRTETETAAATPPVREPVLLLHGAIANSRIFHPGRGASLARELASRNHPAYAADLRGRGQSRPKISRASRFGQTEIIVEDLPKLIDTVLNRHPDTEKLWLVAHSWGGVLALSTLARHPALCEKIRGLIFFGTKRTVRVWNPQRLLRISFYWNFLAPLSAWAYGYLPAREWGVGPDNETRASLAHSIAWVKPRAWVDPLDGFNYGAAIRQAPLPPALYLAGGDDRCLGHPEDVARLVAETGAANAEQWLLSRASGSLHDYDHVSLLTHADAPRDHFPKVFEWMNHVAK